MIELVDVVTEDGLRLHGAFGPRPVPHMTATAPMSSGNPPTAPTALTGPTTIDIIRTEVNVTGSQTSDDGIPADRLDACLFVHGTGSHFYAGGILQYLAAAFQRAGVATLRGNTRGHDVLFRQSTTQGSCWGGAAVESIAECPADLHAWLNFLVDRGHQCIGLIGHSMGAVKSLFTQTRAPHPHVAGLLALSPPRFCHEIWMQDPRAHAFRTAYAEARQRRHDGRADSWMTITQPLPLLITPQGFLEKYGPEDRFDYLPWLAELTTPTLFCVGSRSQQESPAFADAKINWLRATRNRPHLLSVEIADADISYRGAEQSVLQAVSRWLRSLSPLIA